MLVKAIDRRAGFDPYDFGMRAGGLHVVTAILSIERGVVLYCLDSDEPFYVPAGYFDIVDGRMSRHWVFAHEFNVKNPDLPNGYYLGYPEFASNCNYREALFDGDVDAVSLHSKYVKRFLLEFFLPFVDIKAKLIHEDWLMCSQCDEAWQQADNRDEMLCCPKCNALQHWPHNNRHELKNLI